MLGWPRAQCGGSSIEYKLRVEFVGQVDGGRWVVVLRGIDDKEDVREMLVGGEVAVARQAVFITREEIPKNDS